MLASAWEKRSPATLDNAEQFTGSFLVEGGDAVLLLPGDQVGEPVGDGAAGDLDERRALTGAAPVLQPVRDVGGVLRSLCDGEKPDGDA